MPLSSAVRVAPGESAGFRKAQMTQDDRRHGKAGGAREVVLRVFAGLDEIRGWRPRVLQVGLRVLQGMAAIFSTLLVM